MSAASDAFVSGAETTLSAEESTDREVVILWFPGARRLENSGWLTRFLRMIWALCRPRPFNDIGTYTLNGPTGSSSGNYYVISSSEFYFMANPASGSLEIGQADAQTGTTLAAGTYVFGSRGDTINNQPGIHSTGVFTTDGKGNITSGTVDYIQEAREASQGSALRSDR